MTRAQPPDWGIERQRLASADRRRREDRAFAAWLAAVLLAGALLLIAAGDGLSLILNGGL